MLRTSKRACNRFRVFVHRTVYTSKNFIHSFLADAKNSLILCNASRIASPELPNVPLFASLLLHYSTLTPIAFCVSTVNGLKFTLDTSTALIGCT